MTNDRSCPECGRPLPPDAQEQVCPMCALQGLLKFVTDGTQPQPTSTDSAASARTNVRFGDYELLELLARGGMGVVYKARQVSLNRTVALKMIQAGVLASPAEIKRFHAEAEAIAQLHHPNIVAVYEIGEFEGQHYFSMEYVAGRTLAEIVRDGPLAAVRAAAYAQVIAAAVQYAHQHGILHRDLKPANVIIDEEDHPRITDFGLAKWFEDAALRIPHFAFTLSGQVLGSPNYLSPEQAEPKRGALGPSSDVYALGAILYHLITGRPPFQADSLTTLLRQVVETDPVDPRSLNPGIPRDLETICLKCLEKEPQRRYATAQALADDLERFLKRGPVLARPIGVAGRASRWCRRRPVLASLEATLALVLFLGIGGISWQWHRAERERRTAIANEQLALRQAYAGDMNLVQRLVEAGDLGRARRLLDRYRPKTKSELDLRGWEWRYLWGRCRSDDHLLLSQDTNRYADLALAPNGKLLAARKDTGDIELWDLVTRQRVATLHNQGWLSNMGFTPDGRFLVSANSDISGRPVLSFWDPGTGQIVRNLPQPTAVAGLAVSPDGKHLATLHMDKDSQVRLWGIPAGELLREWSTPQSYVGTSPVLLFSPDGTTLAVGETSGQIQISNLETGATNVIPVPLRGEGTSALAFSPDGTFLASAYAWTDSAIYLWDVATGNPLGQLKGHPRFVERLVFAPDGQTLYSASSDGSIGVWDVQHRQQIGQLHGHVNQVVGLAFCPDTHTLVSASYDGSIRLWDLPVKVRSQSEVALAGSVGRYGSVFTADSRRLITASPAGPITVWDVGTTNAVARIAGLGTNNISVALSPDGGLLAVGGIDGSVRLWDLEKDCLVKQWSAGPGPVWAVQFLDAGRTLQSGVILPGLRADLKYWEVGSGKRLPLASMDLETCFGFAQSPDQHLFAVSYNYKPVKLWEVGSGRLKSTLGSDGGFTPTFSPDSRLVAAALRSAGTQIWEVDSGRRVAVLQQLGAGTQCAAFSPDGKRLVAGSWGVSETTCTVHIWDYLVERELLSLSSPDRSTGWVQFSPDGNTLLAVSWSGLATLWRAPSWAEIEAVEKRVPTP